MTEDTAKLSNKLADVMAAVSRIPKNGWNDFHKYHYATEADIADAIRGELASRHVCLVPSVESYEIREIPSKKAEKDSRFVTFLSMTFTFEDGETGQRIEKRWLGAGEDSGDKGVYKAMTGAEKYFLLKTFLIPTGDDPEKDEKKVQGKIKAEAKAPDNLPAVIPEDSHLIQKCEQLITEADKPYWQFILTSGEAVMTWKQQVGSFLEQACQEGKPERLQIRGKFQEMGVVQSATPVEPLVPKPNSGAKAHASKELTAADIAF
jgi:hypothetical protein